MITEMLATTNSETMCSINCNHKMYGSGKITKIRCSEYLARPELFLTFESEVKSATLAYTIAVKFLEFDETDTQTLKDLMSEYTENWLAVEAEHKAKVEAEQEAKKQAIAAKKAEEKYERAKVKAIADFEALAGATRPAAAVDEFYYSLGWLAKHVGVITAKLPDYLGGAFEKHFGVEAPKTLIDGRAKTIGGYAKQWSWEFVASVKKLKDTTVPAYLQTVTSEISKGIHNTSFVWDLVDNYGFQFGKTQDLDKIRSHVPFEYLASFEAGLA